MAELNAKDFHFHRADQPMWRGDAVVLIGTGYSLDGFDLQQLKGLAKIVAVNEAWRLCSFFDVLLSGDRKWPQDGDKQKQLLEIAASGRLWLIINRDKATRWALIEGARYVDRTGASTDAAMSEDPWKVSLGFTSGYAALSFAYHRRPKSIFLFGYDYRRSKERHHALGPGGRQLNPWNMDTHQVSFNTWAKHFHTTKAQLKAAGIEVWNCNPESAVDAFPKITQSEGLDRLRRIGAQQGATP